MPERIHDENDTSKQGESVIGEYLSAVSGWKLWGWIGASLGASVGVAAMAEMSRSRQFLTYFCGLISGGMLAPMACWKFGVPQEFSGAVGFLIGVPGMGVARFIILAGSDPWAIWERIKGRKNG